MNIRPSVWVGAALVVVVAGVVVLRLQKEKPTPTPAPSASTPAPTALWVSANVPGPLRAISSGAEETYAVGDHGVLVSRRNGENAWTNESPVTDRTLYAVAQRGNDVFAVGDGVIVERANGTWKLTSGVPMLRGATYSWMGPLAVGDKGAIGILGPSGWRWETSGTTVGLRGVCAGLTEVLAVGESGTVLRWAGTWKTEPLTTSEDLEAITCDDTHAVAVGRNGVAIERENGSWKTLSTSGPHLFAVASTFGMKSWLAVGEKGSVIRSLGAEPTPLKGDLFGVANGPQGEIVVGVGGLFVRAH
jgi:hypothetical protein